MFGFTKQKPWASGEPIIDVIRRWDGKQPLSLSDEPLPATGTMRAGAKNDLRRTPHDEASLVSEFTELIRLLTLRGGDQARASLYETAVQYSVISVIDVVTYELNKQSWWDPSKMRAHARWFVANSRHREPLKFGIAMLGLSGRAQDIETLRTLGRYDEFTIYAAIAIANLLEDPVDEWWQMAKQVHGWGKIHLVKRLARRAEGNAPLQDWLLREGRKNSIMTEYVALACANACRLDQVLSGDVDDEQLDAACSLVAALIGAGPAENLEDYEGGVPAITNLLNHLDTRCKSVPHVHAVACIRDWVAAPEKPQTWERRAEQLGWTPAVREDVVRRCESILFRPHWPQQLLESFRSDRQARPLIWTVASTISLDLFDEAFAALERDPHDDQLYARMLHKCDDERGERVTRLAEQRLNFAEIITGPSTQMLSPSRAIRSLDALLAYLRRARRFSDPLVAAALRCSAVRLRSCALEIVMQTQGEQVGNKTRSALEQLRLDEPDIKLRARLQELR